MVPPDCDVLQSVLETTPGFGAPGCLCHPAGLVLFFVVLCVVYVCLAFVFFVVGVLGLFRCFLGVLGV